MDQCCPDPVRRSVRGEEHRRVALIDSAKVQILTPSRSGSQRPVRTEEFSIVGVFDVDWLLEPRFQRLLDNIAASPIAFRTVRFFGSLNSGTRENIDPTDSGIVWPSVASPMDFSVTFNALEALTSRSLMPFVVLSFFPSAVSRSPTLPPASFAQLEEAHTRLPRPTRCRSAFRRLCDPSLVV